MYFVKIFYRFKYWNIITLKKFVISNGTTNAIFGLDDAVYLVMITRADGVKSRIKLVCIKNVFIVYNENNANFKRKGRKYLVNVMYDNWECFIRPQENF